MLASHRGDVGGRRSSLPGKGEVCERTSRILPRNLVLLITVASVSTGAVRDLVEIVFSGGTATVEEVFELSRVPA